MADLNTNTGTIGTGGTSAAGSFSSNHKFYVAEFIAIANPELVYDMFGTPANISENNSNTIVFNKVAKLGTKEGTALTEGVTPTEQQFTMSRLEKAIDQYGGFATTTDRLSSESINGLTSQFNMRIAEQGAETMNKVVRDDLNGGTNVRYAGGVATRDLILSSTMPFTDYTYMFKAFKNEKVKPIRPMTMGSPNTGTLPTRETYPVIVPWEATGLLEALDDSLGNAFEIGRAHV